MSGLKLYCICRRVSKGLMIECEDCKEWFHGTCVNIKAKNIPKEWYCPICARCHSMRHRILEEIENYKTHLDAKFCEIQSEIQNKLVYVQEPSNQEKDVDCLQEKLDVAQGKIKDLESEKVSCMLKMQKAEEKCQELEVSITSSRTEWHEKDQKIVALKLELEHSLNKVKDLESEKESCMLKILKAEERCCELEGCITLSRTKECQKDQEIINLKLELQDALQKLKELVSFQNEDSKLQSQNPISEVKEQVFMSQPVSSSKPNTEGREKVFLSQPKPIVKISRLSLKRKK